MEARNIGKAWRFFEGKYVRKHSGLNLDINGPLRVFHILDSLPDGFFGKKEANLLHKLLQKHFPKKKLKEGHNKVNVAQVSFHLL